MSARIDPDALPILTHTRVLGVDIAVKQRENERGDNRDPRAVRIEAYGRDEVHTDYVHRDMAAWARRNLFDGVSAE